MRPSPRRYTGTYADCWLFDSACVILHVLRKADCFHHELFLVNETMYSDILRIMDFEDCFDFLHDPDVAGSFVI